MIRKASYGNMDWLNALEAAAKPKNPTADLGAQNEADLIANAMESTARTAFNLPVDPETKNEAVVRASKEIADRSAQQMKNAASNEIKTKIANNGIDPVALGITIREANGKQRPITQEEWAGATDARFVEKIATEAALAYEKKLKSAWEQEGMKPSQTLSSKFDPATMRDGRIMSSTAAQEETRGFNHQVPANAASIFDPFKLQNYAKAENAHDEAVKASKELNKNRQDEKKAQYISKDLGPDAMKAGQVIRAGGQDADVFVQRVPSNQISLRDTAATAKLTPEEIKVHLANMFTRVDDNGEKIKAAAKEHKEKIQTKKEADRSWEKLEKPVSTSEFSKRLMDTLWPEKTDGQ